MVEPSSRELLKPSGTAYGLRSADLEIEEYWVSLHQHTQHTADHVKGHRRYDTPTESYVGFVYSAELLL